MPPAPMRIAFVYDALYPWVNGGGERRYHELARRLADRHDVHMVSWQWWDGPSVVRRDGLTLHGVGRPPALYGGDGKRTVREAVAFSARLMPTLLRNRWDVIDCSATPYLPLYATWLATRLTGTRLVATWHEFWGEHWDAYLPRRPVVAAIARRLEAGARRLGDQLVAVSDFTARRMDARHELRLTVVGNGVTLRELDAAPAAQEDSGRTSELIYVGRLIDEKRVDVLLDALDELRHTFPDVRCSIVGQGPELAQLRRRAEDLGIQRHVAFLPWVREVELFGLIKSAQILVLPSVREGFGMTVAEAQACGTVPVVVRSDASAAADLVRDGFDGLIADSTAASLASAIASLLADQPRLRAISAQARAAGVARDWDLIATQMVDIYDGDERTLAAGAAAHDSEQAHLPVRSAT